MSDEQKDIALSFHKINKTVTVSDKLDVDLINYFVDQRKDEIFQKD